MPRSSFHSARLKVQWSNKHLAEFKGFAEHFVRSDFYEVTTEFIPADLKTQRGARNVLAVKVKQIPPNFSLLVGDCIHCLRSALDHVATQIVSEHTGKNERIYFPFHETRVNLEDAVSKSLIVKAVPALENIILDDINPCREGSEDLWLVSRINNIDKHNEIVVAVGVARVHIERVVSENNNVFERITVSVNNGGASFPIGDSSRLKIDGQTRAAIKILFGAMPFLEGRDVLQTLLGMNKLVANALEAIEAEYLR